MITVNELKGVAEDMVNAGEGDSVLCFHLVDTKTEKVLTYEINGIAIGGDDSPRLYLSNISYKELVEIKERKEKTMNERAENDRDELDYKLVGRGTHYFKSNGYGSHDDKNLVSNISGVISVEDYCKWYSLFYIDKDGTVSDLKDSDDIDYIDHTWWPSSVVEYAKVHNLKIGSKSFEAIILMFIEGKWDNTHSLPEDFLPTKEDYDKVIVEDFGDYYNCNFELDETDLINGLKLWKD